MSECKRTFNSLQPRPAHVGHFRKLGGRTCFDLQSNESVVSVEFVSSARARSSSTESEHDVPIWLHRRSSRSELFLASAVASALIPRDPMQLDSRLRARRVAFTPGEVRVVGVVVALLVVVARGAAAAHGARDRGRRAPSTSAQAVAAESLSCRCAMRTSVAAVLARKAPMSVIFCDSSRRGNLRSPVSVYTPPSPSGGSSLAPICVSVLSCRVAAAVNVLL